MTIELKNVNVYCYRLQGNPNYCRLAICAENKKKAYEYAEKIKKEFEEDGNIFSIQEDDIKNTKDINFVIAQ